MVDTAQSKETSAKETITSLKEEIANLSGLVEKSAALTGTQEGMVQELTAARDELQRQTEEATGTCKVLETQLTNMTEVLEGERLECATLRGDKADLEQSLAARSAEVQRGQRSKERLDKELKNTLKLLEARTGEQESLTAEATEAKAHGKELETQLNDARNTMDKYLRDYDTLYQRTQKLTEDLEEQITKNQQQHLEGSWSASFFTPSTRLVLIRECAGCFFERFRAASDRVVITYAHRRPAAEDHQADERGRHSTRLGEEAGRAQGG